MGLLTIVVELSCYLSIGVYLYKHNKTLLDILPKDKAHKRARKNAIDLVGHAINFIYEVFFLLFLTISFPMAPQNIQFLYRCISMCPYGLYAITHLAFSRPLRQELAEVLGIIMICLFKFMGYLNFLGIFGSLYQRRLLYRR